MHRPSGSPSNGGFSQYAPSQEYFIQLLQAVMTEFLKNPLNNKSWFYRPFSRYLAQGVQERSGLLQPLHEVSPWRCLQ